MFRFFVLFALFLSPLSADSIPSIPNLFFPEDSVRNKVGAQDNRLIFQLGEMCREPDMQSARFWWRHSFYPATVNDYLKIEAALGTRENLWLGQVISYWGMAAALVARGTLGEPALLSADFSEELFEVFCKVRPFLADRRRRSRKPGLLRNIGELATGSRKSRQRLAIAHKECFSRRKEISHRLAKAANPCCSSPAKGG